MISKAVVGLNIKEKDPMAVSRLIDELCITCAKGRQHKETMTGNHQKTTNLLENIPSDVCGAMQTATHTGERYFVTFIDEASGWVAIASIQSKSEVFENFIAYKRRAEKDTGKEIKTLP